MELAKRAVACKKWQWMPGMLAIGDIASDSMRVVRAHAAAIENEDTIASTNAIVVDGLQRWNYLPDLIDPATIGCLLQLVIEAYPDGVVLGVNDLQWAKIHEAQRVWINTHYNDDTCQLSRRGTIAEALIAALERAE